MTWTYDISSDRGEMKVYDKNKNLIEIKQNSGDGFELPNDVYQIMRNEAEKARSNGKMERWRDIHIRLADNDIAPKE